MGGIFFCIILPLIFFYCPALLFLIKYQDKIFYDAWEGKEIEEPLVISELFEKIRKPVSIYKDLNLK